MTYNELNKILTDYTKNATPATQGTIAVVFDSLYNKTDITREDITKTVNTYRASEAKRKALKNVIFTAMD